MNDKYSNYNQQEEGFFSRMNREREEQESMLSEKQIVNRKKQHSLAVLLSIGVMYIVAEGIFAYIGILIQKIGAYSIGVIRNGWSQSAMDSYNHVYYTLGLIFFVGLSLILYYVAFDKKIKAFLSKNTLYIVPMFICVGITVFTVWMVSVSQLVVFNTHRTAYVDISHYGPNSMTFLTMVGWPCFIGMFAGVQLIKNMIIVSMEKKKKQ